MVKFDVKKYFLLFTIYSVVGWILEVLLAVVCLHKFVNRGFLIGPYLPIYGFGCILIVLLLDKYKDKPVLIVLLSILICSTLEYFTSFLLEVAFNTRWWDYSNVFANINGRICLSTTLLFGMLGALIIYIVNPFFVKLLDKLSNKWVNTIFVIFICIFSLDTILSLTSILSIRNSFDGKIKDTTEEVSKRAIRFIKDIILNIKELVL